MQINVSKVSTSKVEVNVVVPADVVKAKYNASLKNITKNARVDGFRKGHVPENTIIAMYSDRIIEGAFNEIFNEAFLQSIKEGKFIAPRDASPSITKMEQINPAADLPFTFEVEVYPMLESKDLSGVQNEIVKVEISDSDIDAVVEELRKQQSKLEIVDGAEIAAGTVAKIDFLGKKDGVAFEGGKAEQYDLDIDSAKMIPGFVESLMGHKAGEEFTIECTFPEDYGVAELAGAKATFDIVVHQVSKRVLPELNNDFLAAYGFEGKSIEDFKKSLAQNLKHQADALSLNYNLSNVVTAITEAYGEFDVPSALVNVMATNFVKRQFGPKADDKVVNALKSAFAPQAEDKVREDCVVQYLIGEHKFDLDVSSAEVDALIEEHSISYDDPEEFKAEVKKDRDMLANLKASAVNRKLLNCLQGLINCTETVKNFNDFKDLLAKAEQEREAKAQEKMLARAAAKAKAESEAKTEAAAE